MVIFGIWRCSEDLIGFADEFYVDYFKKRSQDKPRFLTRNIFGAIEIVIWYFNWYFWNTEGS